MPILWKWIRCFIKSFKHDISIFLLWLKTKIKFLPCSVLDGFGFSKQLCTRAKICTPPNTKDYWISMLYAVYFFTSC